MAFFKSYLCFFSATFESNEDYDQHSEKENELVENLKHTLRNINYKRAKSAQKLQLDQKLLYRTKSAEIFYELGKTYSRRMFDNADSCNAATLQKSESKDEIL